MRAGLCRRANAPAMSASSPALHSVIDASHGQIQSKAISGEIVGMTAQRLSEGGFES